MKGYGAFAAALLCGLLSLSAGAEDRFDVALSVTSDYVFRGLTQTQGDPAAQADLHWQRDDTWLAGVWASTMDPNRGRGPATEFNLYAGASWQLASDWQARLIAVHYLFPNDTRTLRWDYDELVASLAWRDAVVATVAWSPNATSVSSGRVATDRRAISYEVTGHWPVRPRWLASAGVGYYDLQDLFGSGYAYWNAGFTFDWAPLKVTLARFGTNGQAQELYGEEITHDRWAAGVMWQFGGAVR